MPNIKNDLATMKGWATAHVIFFIVVALIVGFALGRVIH
jgi:hypothetical protein